MVRQGEVPAGVDPDNHGFIPKLWFQAQASDWIQNYKYVWLMDEDISFADGFLYHEFWVRHQTLFPHGPPLLSQPTIRQNGQWFELLTNANTYPCGTQFRRATSTDRRREILALARATRGGTEDEAGQLEQRLGS